MSDHPSINPGDWIEVGNTDCVVCRAYKSGSPFGICEVVFNQSKPTNHDVEWDGEKWIFAERGDFGGYADKYPRLSTYVSILRRGRY